MSYIGNTLENQNYVPAIDYFNGDGSTVAFTLSRPVASVAAVQAVISNVPQNPGSAFTVSGSTITFTSAPPSGTANIYVYYTSPNTQVVQPGQGTVSTTSIADGAVTPAKLSTGGPSWDSSGNITGTGYLRLAATGYLGFAGGTNYFRGDNANNTVYVGTNNVDRITIDSSGRVLTPYQPAFRVRMSTNGNTSVANGSVLPFDTAMYNVGSHFNTSTYRFTAPVSGVYAFSYHSYKNGSGNPSLIAARKNTDALFRTRNNDTGDVVIVAAFSTYLSANDYVDVVNDSGVTFVAYDNTSGSYTSFEGYLVG
jgi:hypothetical protein